MDDDTVPCVVSPSFMVGRMDGVHLATIKRVQIAVLSQSPWCNSHRRLSGTTVPFGPSHQGGRKRMLYRTMSVLPNFQACSPPSISLPPDLSESPQTGMRQ